MIFKILLMFPTRFTPNYTAEYIKKVHPESKLNIQFNSNIDLSRFDGSWTIHPIIELLKAGRFEPLKTLDSKTSLNKKVEEIASCISINRVPACQANWPQFTPGTPIKVPQIFFELLKNLDLAERAVNFRLCRDFFYYFETQRERRFSDQLATSFTLLSLASTISSIFMFAFEKNTPLTEKLITSIVFLPLYPIPIIFLRVSIYTLTNFFTKPNYPKSVDLDAVKITQDLEGAKYYLECQKSLHPSKKEHYDQRIRQLEANFHKKKVEVANNFFSEIIEKIKLIVLKVFYFIFCIKSTLNKDPFKEKST